MRPTLLTAILGWLLPGCISLGAFQGPDVLPEGKTEVGVGIVGGGSLEEGGGGVGMFELYGRRGMTPRLELGARTTGFLATEGIATGAIMVEGKYQLVTTRPLVSAGMGVSFYALEVDDDSFYTIGLYPALWIGSPNLFAGVRMIVVTMGAENSDEVGTGSLVGLTIGGRLGDRVPFRPELTLFAPLGGPPLLVGGLGIAVRL
ncbi:hypothetical protein [Rhodothermus marinus]|uniref:Lipoprotein n=1 Tax=Rhodothermus marinus (strain ATCC 43812 / DSM 4252 / R-10) TaxID=518766 RepID=D0MK32_RHOM4|nr:hypothetical protein [Rhodothermus marinus]ACY46945.1 hypothetical protein Rmar_0036 [Rhodothermus marinus DSM 4252]